MSDGKIWAVIPAAGTGSRFGSSLPKQYASLAGSTVIEHSVAALLKSHLFSNIVVAISPSDRWYAENLLAKNQSVQQVFGGDSRASSVFNGLVALKGQASKNDFVMVHDAARPLLHQDDILCLVESLSGESSGGILAKPIVDTLKQARLCEGGHMVTETVDRERMWAAQTPQMFRFGMLFSALQSALQETSSKSSSKGDGNFVITDEASAMEHLGYSVKIIESRYENFKITQANDLKLAEFYLAERAKTQIVKT